LIDINDESTDGQPPPAMTDIVGEAGKDQFLRFFSANRQIRPWRTSSLALISAWILICRRNMSTTTNSQSDPQAFWDVMHTIMLKLVENVGSS
jgi:hypothetical protein